MLDAYTGANSEYQSSCLQDKRITHWAMSYVPAFIFQYCVNSYFLKSHANKYNFT